MIAIDTNLLVYAHREDSPFHTACLGAIRPIVEGRVPWGLPWPCVHEVFSIVTHPKIYRPPSPPSKALAFLTSLLESPHVRLLGERPGYFDSLSRLIRSARIAGPRVHDARIAAICLQHGVQELWTSDRDFSAFPNLVVRNPLV